MAIADGDLMRAKFFVRCLDQLALNTRHFVVSSHTGSPTTEQALADAVSQALAIPYKGVINGSATFFGVQLDRLTGSIWTTVASSRIGTGLGTGGLPPLPLQTTGVATILSSGPGRRGRGRMYLPFPGGPAGDAVTGRPTATYQTNASTLAALVTGLDTFAIAVPLGTTTVQWSVFSMATGIPTFYPSNTFIIRPKWGLMHKRGDYGRPNPDPF